MSNGRVSSETKAGRFPDAVKGRIYVKWRETENGIK
jgi:hypothetical protein